MLPRNSKSDPFLEISKALKNTLIVIAPVPRTYYYSSLKSYKTAKFKQLKISYSVLAKK